jgi:hypothetical protein
LRCAATPDFTLLVTSTPTAGTVEIEKDEVSGLEFWKVVDQDDIASLETCSAIKG